MDLREQLQSPKKYVKTLTKLQGLRNKPHHRYKTLFGCLVEEDVYLHKTQLAKAICSSIKAQQFIYQPLKESVIRQKNKLRSIYPLFISDRLVHSLIQKYYANVFEIIYSDNLMSYRKGRSSSEACHRVSQYIKNNSYVDNGTTKVDLYILQVDLQNYTDTIPISDNAPIWKLLRPLKEDNYSWQLLKSALQSTYQGNDGLFSKPVGIPMGSPLTSLIANLYLTPLDHQLSQITNGCYLRFGDDIIFMHHNPNVVLKTMSYILHETTKLGLTINPTKTHFTYLTRSGCPSKHDNFTGCSNIHYLGHRINGHGHTSLDPIKEQTLINQLKQKIYNSGNILNHLPDTEKGKALCNMLNNVILNTAAGETSDIQTHLSRINNRQRLKQIDYQIAFEIAKYLSNHNSVKAFRQIPYKVIRNEFGLISLCQLRNKMRLHGKD